MGANDIRAGGAFVELYGKDAMLARDLQRASSMITRWGQGVASSLGLALGGFQIGSFLHGSIGEAAKAETSRLRLASAMKVSGQLTDDAFNSAVKFSEELSLTTRYTDEQVQAVMALGASLGDLSGRTLQDATKAAIGWGETMGVDAEEALRSMISAANGSRDSFKKYGLDLDRFSTVQEKLNFLVREGASGYQMHQAIVAGTEGNISATAKAWDEFKESVGAAFIETTNMNDALRSLNRSMGESQSGASDVGTFFGGVAQAAGSIVRTVWSGMSGIGKGLVGGGALVAGQTQFGGSMVAQASEDFGKIGASWSDTLSGTGQMKPGEMRKYLQARGVPASDIERIMSRYGAGGKYTGAPNVPNVGVRERPEVDPVHFGMMEASAVPGTPRIPNASLPSGGAAMQVRIDDDQVRQLAQRGVSQVAP